MKCDLQLVNNNIILLSSFKPCQEHYCKKKLAWQVIWIHWSELPFKHPTLKGLSLSHNKYFFEFYKLCFDQETYQVLRKVRISGKMLSAWCRTAAEMWINCKQQTARYLICIWKTVPYILVMFSKLVLSQRKHLSCCS